MFCTGIALVREIGGENKNKCLRNELLYRPSLSSSVVTVVGAAVVTASGASACVVATGGSVEAAGGVVSTAPPGRPAEPDVVTG